MPTTPEQLWPPFALHVRCGPLDMQAVRDDDLPGLADLAARGIHDADAMPFYVPWSTRPGDQLDRGIAAYHWRTRASAGPAAWTLDLAVRRDGVLVGTQGISTTDYPVTRTGETGSWLGREHQGRGTGTLMRQAICALMFDHLGAEEVTSGAFTDNPASHAVSRKVGYLRNGERRRERRPGEPAVVVDFLLSPERFVRPPHPVEVTGADDLRRFLEISP